MRAPAAASLALLLAATDASALVTEPNGDVVPKDSQNGEVQLYSLFSQLGEGIDWQADAASTPGAFSPLCGFAATFVLHEAGSSLGIAWYNAGNGAPGPADLHVVVPAGAAVGTVIASADIKKDPAYSGGLVGFALVGGQTHYSEVSLDPVCSGCNPPAPWITAVIYPSKNTPNAYYVAFEDGPMGADPGSFNNDGDFNDYVYFLTGITCSGGGLPCDTGVPGACGPGLTKCTPSGTTCQGLAQPAPKETCNGLDDDCDGETDEGDLCQPGFVCDKGTCVAACGAGEFTCPPSKVCDKGGHCVDPKCKDKTCDAGKVCVGGVCEGACDGIACPAPAVCRAGACVDPCAGVACDAGEVCEEGVCLPTCACSPCAAGKACDAASGRCVAPDCVGVPCDAGTVCKAGKCVDACVGATCPAGEVCAKGACVPGQGGAGGAGGSPIEIGDGGAGGGGSAHGEGGLGTEGHGVAGEDDAAGSGSAGGCGCEVGARGGGGAISVALAAAAIAWGRRRTRRRAPPTCD